VGIFKNLFFFSFLQTILEKETERSGIYCWNLWGLPPWVFFFFFFFFGLYYFWSLLTRYLEAKLMADIPLFFLPQILTECLLCTAGSSDPGWDGMMDMYTHWQVPRAVD
jgi:hypothetical protein